MIILIANSKSWGIYSLCYDLIKYFKEGKEVLPRTSVVVPLLVVVVAVLVVVVEVVVEGVSVVALTNIKRIKTSKLLWH